jgi:hypothetical protein|tara:strand:- start:426 stop:599 length:174 start_codon:yes stop_codon:yes gene_type:complete
MPTTLNIFFDGTFFCSATAIFLNADLTVFAESDFYAFGGFKRYWNKTTGVLGDCETC